MLKPIIFKKVLDSLPDTLTPNTLYFIKKEDKVELYISTDDGQSALKIDSTQNLEEPVTLFDTINDMLLSTPIVGNTVKVNSYKGKGTEQGGGCFICVNKILTEDKGYVFTSLSNDSYQWIRIAPDASRTYIEYFGAGAVDNNVRNDLEAFKAAIQYCSKNNTTLCLAENTVIYLSEGVDIPYIGVDLRGTVYGTSLEQDPPAYILSYSGNSKENFRHNSLYFNKVLFYVESHQTDLEWVGPSLTLSGLKSTTVTVNHTHSLLLNAHERSTTPPEYLKGKHSSLNVDSIAYCTFNINVISRIMLEGQTANSWINENTFNLNRVVHTNNLRTGIQIKGLYNHNHNLFVRGTFEKTQYIEFDCGHNNQIIGARFEREGVSASTEKLNIKFAKGTYANRIQCSWYMTPQTYHNGPYANLDNPRISVTDLGIDNTITHIQEQYSDDVGYLNLTSNTPHISSVNITDTCNTDIEGLRFIKHLPNGKYQLIGDYKELYNPNTTIPVTKGTMFTFNSDQTYFRIEVFLFDSNGNQIKDVTNLLHSYKLRLDNSKTKFIASTNLNSCVFTVIDSKVSAARIVIRSGNSVNGKLFSSFISSIRYPKTYNLGQREYLDNYEPKRLTNLYSFNTEQEDKSLLSENVNLVSLDKNKDSYLCFLRQTGKTGQIATVSGLNRINVTFDNQNKAPIATLGTVDELGYYFLLSFTNTDNNSVSSYVVKNITNTSVSIAEQVSIPVDTKFVLTGIKVQKQSNTASQNTSAEPTTKFTTITGNRMAGLGSSTSIDLPVPRNKIVSISARADGEMYSFTEANGINMTISDFGIEVHNSTQNSDSILAPLTLYIWYIE